MGDIIPFRKPGESPVSPSEPVKSGPMQAKPRLAYIIRKQTVIRVPPTR
jgi:hypothetical protein